MLFWYLTAIWKSKSQKERERKRERENIKVAGWKKGGKTERDGFPGGGHCPLLPPPPDAHA